MATVTRFTKNANLFLLLPPFEEGAILDGGINQVAFTTVGAHTWTCPDSVTLISVVCIGGGGAGGVAGGGGGGGGALTYANNVSVTPGETYNIYVGAGGDRTSPYGGGLYVDPGPNSTGGTSWFNNSSYLYANGGTGGQGTPYSYRIYGGGGGAGGYAGNGGNGGNALTNPSVPNTYYAGGGGSGGGSCPGRVTYSGGSGGIGNDTIIGNTPTWGPSSFTYGTGSGGGGSAGFGTGGYGGGGVSVYGQSGVDYGGTATRAAPGGGLGNGTFVANGGSGGTDGSTSSGGLYGGGGGGGGNGGRGAVRLLYGPDRFFPTNLTADQPVAPLAARRIKPDGSYKLANEIDEVSINPKALGSIVDAHLCLPYISAYAVGNNNFTIEGWIYHSDPTPSGEIILRLPPSFRLNLNQSTNSLSFIYNIGASDITLSTDANTLLRNSWHHFAVTRSGSSLNIYIDGVRSKTASISGTLATPTGNLYIGTDYQQSYPATLTKLTANLGDLRFIKGTALYTGTTYTVPDHAFCDDPATTVFRLKTLKNEYIDASSYAASFIAPPFINGANGEPSSATLSSFNAFKPDGYYSTLFTASSSSYINNNLIAGTAGILDQTADFTLEFWMKISSLPTSGTGTTTQYSYIIAVDPGTDNSYNIALSDSGIIVNRWISSVDVATELSASVPVGSWTHIALGRIGAGTNNLTLYIDGAVAAQSTQSAVCSAAASNNAIIAYTGNTADPGSLPLGPQFAGYISNLRYTNGIGVYTNAFTVPANPLKKTQDAGTNISAITAGSVALLTCQSAAFKDNSTYRLAVSQGAAPDYLPAIDDGCPDKFTDIAYNGQDANNPDSFDWSNTGKTASKLVGGGTLIIGGILDEMDW
jgi:hypothetical protein